MDILHNFLTYINSLDRNILDFIQNNMRNPFLDRVMPFITALGNGGIFWILICIILLITKKYRKAGMVCALSLIITTILGDGIIKNLIQRSRPFMQDASMVLLIAKPITFSFPSGHTASSFAAAAALSTYIKPYGKLFFIPAALIAFSRLYLYVHFPSDVLGGIILGIVGFKLGDIFYNKLIRKRIAS